MTSATAGRKPRRLVFRTLAGTFATVALVLSATFIVLTIEVRNRVRDAVIANLGASQDVYAQIEKNRQRELHERAAGLADSPDLASAMTAYLASTAGGAVPPTRVAAAVQREVQRLADRIQTDVIAVTDARNSTLASAGELSWAWPTEREVVVTGILGDSHGSEGIVRVPGGLFRVVVAPLKSQGATIGRLYLATSIDQRYAKDLGRVARADTAIVAGGRVIATTLPARAQAGLPALSAQQTEGTVSLEGERYAFLKFFEVGETGFYALESIDAASAQATTEALKTLGSVGVGALLLAAFASFWLARALTRPINHLSMSLAEIATSRRFDVRLKPTGTSQELDALTNTFNELMASLSRAQAETQNASLGAIRALALALDARDPYTAGHSERVATLSVSIGRQIKLSDKDLEVLRLGAVLHDIGKIGLADEVLRKPGSLTDEEFELIKLHPILGARILKSVQFLEPHLPIVELHHERLDGRGYPHGLRGEEIPLLARIVHVADAYDAMTSARAYRFARSSSDAIAELWHCRGSDFDPAIVDAFIQVLPSVATHEIVDTPSMPIRTPRVRTSFSVVEGEKQEAAVS